MAPSQETRPRLCASPTQTAFCLSSQISICPSKGLFALNITLPLHYSTNCPSSSCWATNMTCPNFTPPWGSQKTGHPPCTHRPPKPACRSTAPTVRVGGAGARVPSRWTPQQAGQAQAPPKELSPQTHGTPLLKSPSETASGKGGEERTQGPKTEATRCTHLVAPSFPQTLALSASAATQRAHRGEEGTANFGHHEKYPAK